MKNHWINEAAKREPNLYDFMLDYLDNNRCCNQCGNKLWARYSGGHVADVCLDCPPKPFFSVNPDGSCSLDMPGYITYYSMPRYSLPECIEYRECPQWETPPEGYYRMKD